VNCTVTDGSAVVARGPEWTWKVQPPVGKRRCWSVGSAIGSMVVQSVGFL